MRSEHFTFFILLSKKLSTINGRHFFKIFVVTLLIIVQKDPESFFQLYLILKVRNSDYSMC